MYKRRVHLSYLVAISLFSKLKSKTFHIIKILSFSGTINYPFVYLSRIFSVISQNLAIVYLVLKAKNLLILIWKAKYKNATFAIPKSKCPKNIFLVTSLFQTSDKKLNCI